MPLSIKLRIAGILDIVIGSLSVAFALVMLIGGIITLDVPGGGSIFILIAIIFAIMGIPPIFGGIYTLRRKRLHLAITCSLFISLFWGIGLVTAFLISSAKDEFK